MSSADCSDLCRLCLVKERVTVPIFEGEGDARRIFTKISTCLPVKISREDKLPQKLCADCVYKVETFFEFWQTTAVSEKRLQAWLADVEKQDYAVATVLNQSGMKGEQSNENRLDGSGMMQQVSGHQNSLNMVMDNMGMCMSMMMPNNQQQITSVPMDPSGSSVQSIQVVAGSSTHEQITHDQIIQNQTNAPTQQEEEEESSEDEENSDDECDGDGLPIKEESEEDPNNSRTIEPTTFVNVSLACEDPGPSGLQQQKMADIQEMTTAGDPKTGIENPAETSLTNKPSIRECMDTTLVSISVKEENVDSCEENVKHEECRHMQHQAANTAHRQCLAENAEDSLMSEELEEQDNLTDAEISRQNCSLSMRKQLYKCNVCMKLFRSKNLFEGHLVAHSDARPYQCDVCNKSFKRTNTLAVHRRIHTHERNFVCDVCGRAFVQASQLATHHRRHYEKYTRHCEICNKGFFTNAELHGHMNVKHGAKEHVCTACDKQFPNNHTLARHLKIHDPNFKPVKHQCEFCGKMFAYKNSLVVHVKSHTGENKYDCQLCGKSVSSKGSLQDHLRLHSGEKSLVCDVCGKAFRKKTTLVVHKRTHTGEKPYTCDTCGKSFTQHSALVIHKRYHTGQRPYQCTYCNKSFVSRGLLNAHNKVHVVSVMVVQST
ncbi:zinc finger protein 250-like isoform X12 [Harpegnathos saltator]|uniref:zinc finger protein 250-like isoform X12 n=1 Tax=Harpegnathos saltator TaxID=610380 RepID=UPI000DBECF1D|nr:zinc finger protein 250-like isoform X12 [Harpegnathos saltator]